MDKDGITEYQGIALISMYIWGAIFITSAGAGRDAWLIVIIAAVASIPLLLTYGRIMRNFQGKDLYDIIEIVFGRVIGKIVIVVYTMFFLHLGSIIMRNFMEFSRVATLTNTPNVITGIVFGILSSYMVKAGVESFGRWAGIFFIGVTFVSIALGIFAIVQSTNKVGVLPIFYNGYKPVIVSTYSFIAFPIAEVMVFMTIFNSIKGEDYKYNIFVKGVLFALAVALIDIVGVNLLLLREENQDMFFPTFLAVRRMRIGDAVQRIETFISAELAILSFVEFCACVFATCKGVARIFNFEEYKYTTVSISILMVSIALILYESTLEMVEWNSEIWPHYSFPFQILMPITILIAGELKIRKGKLKNIDNKKEREQESLNK
ncbi:endospore germination permease [Clostridium bovifaecis]|uniref:Endospore germination permease n=1 Tax=Clostridium bovifaecis TaxID=2184719 RepID=A0A6I6EZA6_9CLOT|nr:endospore germination permease [Clostridium bovifaecis]